MIAPAADSVEGGRAARAFRRRFRESSLVFNSSNLSSLNRLRNGQFCLVFSNSAWSSKEGWMREIPIDRIFGSPATGSVRTPAICRWVRAIFFGLATTAVLITLDALTANQVPRLGEFLATLFIIVGFLVAN